MKEIKTRISDDDYKKIEQSGMSKYAFLQLAIKEKIENQQTENILIQIVESIAERFDAFENELNTFKEFSYEEREKYKQDVNQQLQLNRKSFEEIKSLLNKG